MNPAQKFRDKWSRLVCRAIFEGTLPEVALSSPWLVVTYNARSYGGGESATFGASAVAWLDGRRVGYVRRTFGYQLDVARLPGLPGRPVLAFESGASVLYWFPPEGPR